jgi:hypothetical protein
VEKLMKQTQKDYKAILDNLDSAEGYPDSKAEQIRGLRRRVFVLIEKEKNEAKRARDEAKKQTEIAKTALAQADSARKKTQAVLDKIYFYEGKFGLAYDEIYGYGFIDKNLNTKIDFKYSEALPFDKNGYAKMRKTENIYINSGYVLVDTFGNEFELATNLSEITSKTTALDLNDSEYRFKEFKRKEIARTIKDSIECKKLEEQMIQEIANSHIYIDSIVNFNDIDDITDSLLFLNTLNMKKHFYELDSITTNISKNKQLKIIYFKNKGLNYFPNNFLSLTDLEYLDLSGNYIVSISEDLQKLKKLKVLKLFANNISKDEQEKIKKLLPNCEINF